MKNFWVWIILASLLVVGCGGSSNDTGSTTGYGSVSGVVFDQTGGVVSSARVWTNNGSGRSTSANLTGAYQLSSVIGTQVLIEAEAYRGGQRYYGQNVTTVTSNEASKNVNIAIYPSNALGRIEGTVRDTSGRLLQGIRVFARQNAVDTVLSSSVAVSDSNGRYSISGLAANLDYAVQANGLNYSSDSTVVNLGVNESRTLNLNVPNYTGSTVNLPAPTNLTAVAWTSPRIETRNPNRPATLAAIKAALGYKKPKVTLNRDTALGNPIEVDLSWFGVINSSTLGYGVYRSTNGGNFFNVDFYRDPLGEFFADQDASLVPNTDYTYGVTTISTSYTGGTGTNNGESGLSNTVGVRPLGDVLINSATAGANVNFSWNSTVGASSYQVVIFAEAPTVGSTPVLTSASVTTTSFSYSASGLTPGARYYFAVIASNSLGDKSVSSLGSFVR